MTSFSDRTNTTACPDCESADRDELGGWFGCGVPECYRGRVSGFGPGEIIKPCDEIQRAAVDRELQQEMSDEPVA